MHRPRPVVGISSYSFHPRTGGSARLALQLARSLPERGWDVVVVAPTITADPTPPPGWPEKARIHWAAAPGIQNYDSHLARTRFARAMAQKVRGLDRSVDVWLSLDFQLGTLAALAGSAPVVAHFGADPIFEFTHYRLARWGDRPGLGTRSALRVLEPALRHYFRRLDRVVAGTEWSTEAVRRYTDAPIEIIPCAVRTDSPSVERSSRPSVLVVSRLVPWKAVDTVLSIGEELARRVENVQLTIIGDGPLRDRVRERAQGDSWLTHLPSVAPDEVHRQFGRAWALLHPSHYETFGIVLIEAMAAGLVVVANDIQPVSDVVENGRTGFLVPPGDTSAYVDRLAQVLESPNSHANIRSAARVVASETYTLESIVSRYDHCLREVVQRHS